jgi:uncharacterized glyoxalase superfamily protein PhnB
LGGIRVGCIISGRRTRRDFTSLIMRFRDVSVGPGRPELAEGGKVGMRVWGGYFGAFADCSGMHWAFNCASRT